jgi:hypothetical protein
MTTPDEEPDGEPYPSLDALLAPAETDEVATGTVIVRGADWLPLPDGPLAPAETVEVAAGTVIVRGAGCPPVLDPDGPYGESGGPEDGAPGVPDPATVMVMTPVVPGFPGADGTVYVMTSTDAVDPPSDGLPVPDAGTVPVVGPVAPDAGMVTVSG